MHHAETLKHLRQFERAEQWQTATEPKSKAAPQASGLGSQSFFEPSPEADHIVGQLTHVFISQRALWVLSFPPFWNGPINAAVVSLMKFYVEASVVLTRRSCLIGRGGARPPQLAVSWAGPIVSQGYPQSRFTTVGSTMVRTSCQSHGARVRS